eukprot:2866375-Rhodomonas_salina.2
MGRKPPCSWSAACMPDTNTLNCGTSLNDHFKAILDFWNCISEAQKAFCPGWRDETRLTLTPCESSDVRTVLETRRPITVRSDGQT